MEDDWTACKDAMPTRDGVYQVIADGNAGAIAVSKWSTVQGRWISLSTYWGAKVSHWRPLTPELRAAVAEQTPDAPAPAQTWRDRPPLL